ncbi:glycosyltransferase family 61 protein [Candidatus Methylopumilus universalis]|uniref:glycosyltransferase family 61 protein n=1 Tax=Candidatus Methylopumilus universalis TaxID=2588536 RepID=UPI00111F16F1|nr:glycosyltransferase family 61 protein [Candidatus Methylopumilus universalis]QDC80373.1 glycosyltransferase family 61 protein [Candidatus Methylopumilus universalis]QDC81674.1 glycosyltransferase family 61 protein [Candidatus Methylopumilus universalis]
MKILKLKFLYPHSKQSSSFFDLAHLKKNKFLLGLYLNFIKPFPLLRKFCLKGYVLAFKVLAWVDFCKYDLVRLKDFVKKNQLKTFILFKPSSTQYINPHICKNSNLDLDFDKFNVKGLNHFESIYLAQIKDVQVLGSTSILFKDKTAIFHDLFDWNLDFTSEELHQTFYYSPLSPHIKINIDQYNKAELTKAASFINPVAANYAHWVTEILPAVAAFCKNPEYKGIPIIINHGLHKNILDSLDLIAGSREIIFLRQNEKIYVKNLYAVSVAGYASFEPRKINIPLSSSGLYNYEALNYVRKILRRKVGSNKKWPKKIFLKRNSGYRNLTNSKEIEALLKKQGFEVYDFQNLSLKDQIGLFSNADIIIGPSGAHFANIIFCNKKTDVYILISNFKGTVYKYWPNISSLFGIQIKYIIGQARIAKSTNVHADFYVNPKLIKESINVK